MTQALQNAATDEQPIIARCTPQGQGAIALLRLSGTGAVLVADQFASLSSKQQLSDLPTHTIHHGRILAADGTTIDEVLFLLMRGPKTYTGHDTVEITTHNNPFIVQQVITRAIQCGARLAGAGEFTRRAVLNQKIDLLQAEAVHDVIAAQSERALNVLQSQLAGTLSHTVAQIEHALLGLLTLTEASFEFLDEEQRDLGFEQNVRTKLAQVQDLITKLSHTSSSATQIRDGVRIALVGSVNAGKSTLFNALLGKDRAIVSSTAGTTRDSVEGTLHRDGVFWTLIDTAGLRITDDVIEQQGIERSRTAAASADIVVLVHDASRMLTHSEQEIYSELQSRHSDKCLLVYSKSDDVSSEALAKGEAQATKSDGLHVSGKTGAGVSGLLAQLSARVTKLFSSHTSPFLLSSRQQTLVSEVATILRQAAKYAGSEIDYELLAHHTNNALARLSQMSGRGVTQDMFDKIFRDFCVGK